MKSTASICVIMTIFTFACSTSRTTFEPKTNLLNDYGHALQDEEPFKAPYVSKFNNGSTELWFIAAQHTDQDESATFKTIKRAFDELHPQVIIIEGVEDTGILSPPGHASYVRRMALKHFRGSSESAYAAWLGLEHNVPYAPSEPTDIAIVQEFVKKGHTRTDYAYFEVARFLPQWKMTGKVHNWNEFREEAERFAQHDFKPLGITDVFNFEDFLKWCHAQLGRDLTYDVTVEDFSPQVDHSPTNMNRLSKEVDGSREPHIHEVTVRMLNQYQRVLIVFGAGHLVKHRAALTSLLGKSQDEQWFPPDSTHTSLEGHFLVPTPKLQKKLVLAIRDEMIRLDGEGLIPRTNRPESFKVTTSKLAKEALKNKTAFDFYRTFSRLDATYPNLHAHVNFGDSLNHELSIPGPGNMDWTNITLATEIFTKEKTRTVIREVTDNEALSKKWEGATLVAINGIPLKKWENENFIFCKWALRSVCNRMMEENLLNGLLLWQGGPLVYQVEKGKEKASLAVTFKKPESNKPTSFERRQCDWRWQKRYPGFTLVHKGYFACLFEKSDEPSTMLLRISSFQYQRGRKVDPKSPIQTMKQETDALKPVWVPRSALVKHLIVDLIDNGGGNEPRDYYNLLLHKPYLEQYVEFKKTPEMEVEENRSAMFWNEKAHELWFQKQKQDGTWAKLRTGQFSKPSPMFCADEDHPCGDIQFQPVEHHFTGKVSVMINDGCVSSCDGVTWQLAKKLNAKLYGFYQAADSAYSRLRVDAIRDPSKAEGFTLKVRPQRVDYPSDLLVSQDVAVTLSVDEDGKVLSGKPLPLEKLVPARWDSDYHRDVLKAVLSGN